jgi:DmsE family decaheme c-type cytochrome
LPAVLNALWIAVLVLPTQIHAEPKYSHLGADACVLCHSFGADRTAVDIFQSKHGSRSDPAAPFSNQQCEACHGPSKDHARARRQGDAALPHVTFGQESDTPAGEQNAICLGCHQSGSRMSWHGSAHEMEEVACASCHRIHAPHDPMSDPMAQQQACFGCHQNKRADTLKPSSHPLRLGNMSCSDCHDPHDANNDFLLREATVNDTCHRCHAEKRGPFLWEHAPAAEDCTLCHRPHGSTQRAMLVRRPPLLCQQCHAPAGHPSVAYTSESIGAGFNNRFALGRACLNCHSQVHGSNHPSGAKLHR